MCGNWISHPGRSIEKTIQHPGKLVGDLESAAVLAGNYFLPGSSLLTSHLVGQDAQKKLGSFAGELGQIGTGLSGSGVGSDFTGIPESAGGAWEGAQLASAGNAISSGFDSTLNSVGNATGFWGSDAAAANAGAVGGAGASGDIAAAAGDAGSAVDPSGFTIAGDTSGSGVTGTATIGGAAPPAVAGLPANGTTAPGFWDSLTSGNFKGALSAAGTDIANNPGLALAGGGMALNALKGNKETGAEKNQAALAAQQAGIGNSEVALGQSGQLAPGQQAVIENQLNNTISQIKSQYAGMGLSGSTSEQAAIAQARQQASATIAQQAQQEINTGLSALGQATSANSALVQQQMQSNPDLSAAILALNASSGVTSKKQAA